jgi:Zn-dependent metalloprotease
MDISSTQRDQLTRLASSTTNLTYRWDDVRGVVTAVRADELVGGGRFDATAESPSPQAALRRFVEAFDGLFGPPNLMESVVPLRERGDELGFTHLDYQQVVVGGGRARKRAVIEVYGSKLAAHFAPGTRLVEVQSSCYATVDVANTVRVTAAGMRDRARKGIADLSGFAELESQMQKREETLFPLMQPPRLVVYPWQDRLIYAWATYGYAPMPDELLVGPADRSAELAFGQMFFDADSGDLFLFAPTRKGAETADTGSGLGCTPLGGPFTNEPLQIVRVDATSTYRLRNTTKARDVVTFDAAANSAWVYPDIPSLIEAGTIPVSADTDGDKNWNRTAATTSNADRTASQQPEVDAHHTVADIYDWYHALSGRVGWDNGQYTAPLVPNQALNVVTHTYDSVWGTSRSVNAFFDQELVSGHWVSHLAFFDGDPTGTTDSTMQFDYLAGSRAIIGHEYRHAVTDFSFVDGSGNPGLTYSGWLAAVHEGTSDVFGGLLDGDWWMGTVVSPTGQIFRNLAFPRDTAAADGNKFDHFADRDNPTTPPGTEPRYFRGTILAHTAFLMAQGGVHQRASRSPALIPVRGLGRETVNGRDFYQAARIWDRAYEHYLSNIGATTGLPTNDESVFRTIRDGCVSAAIDLYGVNTTAHLTTVLAFYATGLHPAGASYGPDVTFITWGADWWMSRPYIGLPSPDWSSIDLFINNGGTSEWNAKVNVMDGGVPTQFENKVYCRVRNVGDQQAQNVQVQFEYAKINSGGTTWFPMTDKDGNLQTLSLGNLGAGQSNFPDSDQNSPPNSAMVKWWIPPIATGETVNHYCIRARVFAINDVNASNSEVQSNIAYLPYVPGTGLRIGFFAGNDRLQPMPAELVLTHTLPEAWSARFLEPVGRIVLKPGESRRFHVVVDAPPTASDALLAPLNGRVHGEGNNGLGAFTGTLTAAAYADGILHGRMALLAADGSALTGAFRGRLDPTTARFEGTVEGGWQRVTGQTVAAAEFRVSGCLRPDRVVNIGQYANGEPVGGLTVQVQVPLPSGSCFEPLPPTDTAVRPTATHDAGCIDQAVGLLDCLRFKDQRICSVDIRSVNVEVTFERPDRC